MSSILPFHYATYPPSILRSRRLTPKSGLLALLIICLLLWIGNIAQRDRWVRDLGYLTRPIWDTAAERPTTIIPHYGLTHLTSNAQVDNDTLCGLHGWHATPPPSHTRILDAFLISVELDLVEIRLRELLDSIDYFLILEATRSFAGTPKPLAFTEALQSGRFAFAQHKIKHIVIHDLDPHPASPFDNEKLMRTRMDALLRQTGVRETDIVLMSDVDEIPSAGTVTLLKTCADWPSPLHLNMRNYRYSFEFPLRDQGYWRPKAVRWTQDVGYNHGRAGDAVLAEAGWHCSWCFRWIEDMQFKMQGYSHNDRLTSSTQLDVKRINKHTCDGSDIFDMFPEAYTFEALYLESGPAPKATSYLNIPDWVIRNPRSFQFLLPGGCLRESKSRANG